MANSDPVEFVLYDTDLITKLAILPVVSGHLYLEHQEPGSGECSIPLVSPSADLVSSGQFVIVYYRGAARGGFFVDNIKPIDADGNEGAGRLMSISGRGPLAILEDAIVFDDGSGASTRAFTDKTKAYILKTLIDEGVTRGALARLDYDFTATHDSNSDPWADSEDYDINVGMTMLDVLRMFSRKVGDIEFKVTLQGGSQPILLSAYGANVGTDRSNSVYMRVGSNCEEVTTDERGDDIKNVYLIKYKDGYAKVQDAGSISARRRRELFLSLEAAQSSSSATTYASAQLTLSKDPHISYNLRVYDGVSPYIFVNYDLSDTITVDKFGEQISKRILGVQMDFTDAGIANVVIDMNYIQREPNDLDWLMKQWNTAKDDNLTEVKQWLSLGQPNGNVYALHYFGGYLYVGGDFTNIPGGIVTTNIAKFNVSTGVWSAMDTGITSGPVGCITDHGGDIYAATQTNVYHFTGGAWSLIGSGSTQIRAMASFGGNLYVGGAQVNFDIGSTNHPVVYWDGSAPWNSSLASSTIACLALIEYNGDLFGGFNTGTTNALRQLAGGSWTAALAANPAGANVAALAVVGDDLAFSGGLSGTAYTYLWDGVSSSAEELFQSTAWGDPGGTKHDALASYLSDIYYGAVFNDIDGEAFGNIARYSGGVLNNLLGGISTTVGDRVNAIAVVDSDIYIGGTFTTAGGKPIANLAVFVTSFESLVTHLSQGGMFDLGGAIHGAAATATLTSNDEFPLWEDVSQDLRKVTYANLKSNLGDTFLKLDASNDPVTRQLDIINATSGDGGLYVQTTGDAYTMDIEQLTSSANVSATTPAVLIFQLSSGAGNIPSSMIDGLRRGSSTGTVSGDFIKLGIYVPGGPNIIQFQVLNDGSVRLPQLADASAVNDSLYYSTDAGKLAYKDSGGTTHALY